MLRVLKKDNASEAEIATEGRPFEQPRSIGFAASACVGNHGVSVVPDSRAQLRRTDRVAQRKATYARDYRRNHRERRKS